MSGHDDDSTADMNPHKELLAEAAAQIQADQVTREEAKPKNVGQGTVGLVSDSLGGVAIGAAALVMGPVQGYKQSGAKGIVGGAIGGIAVGLGATTLGIASGIAKFAQGASKTASNFHSDKPDPKIVISDKDRPSTATYSKERDTLYKSLQDEYNTANSRASMDGLTPPVDQSLYEVLAIEVDATPVQIRKAYYKMAQKYHPDKHPDSPDATAKFQEVSDAYQVLSDPVKREEYHRLGATAATNESMMDPKALFALMFSDFEHLVGDLATSTILSTMGAEGEGEGTDSAKAAMEARKQKKKQFQDMRVAHLVKLLNRRLEPWLRGEEELFLSHAKHEVFALREEPFGRDLLKTVGYVYRKKASKIVDNKGPLKGVQSFFDDIGEKAHSFSSQVRAIEGGVKAMTAAQTGTENESIDETARREAVTTLGAVWLASVVDIEATLKSVVDQVIPSSQHKDRTIARKAAGLLVLGKIFKQA